MNYFWLLFAFKSFEHTMVTDYGVAVLCNGRMDGGQDDITGVGVMTVLWNGNEIHAESMSHS